MIGYFALDKNIISSLIQQLLSMQATSNRIFRADSLLAEAWIDNK
jgi:hypothetical protein